MVNSVFGDSKQFLVKASELCDCVPLVSTVSNIFHLFQKAFILPLLQQSTISNSPYYTYLDRKSFSRCALQAIPLIGNIHAIYIRCKLASEKRKDREGVLTAVQQNGMALANASAEMQNDPEVVLAAVQQNRWALLFASAKMQNDPKVVSAAVQKDGWALRFASAKMQNNPEVVSAAVQQNGLVFQYASETLRKDREFVLAMVQKDSRAFQYASETLRKDEEFVLAAVRLNEEIMDYVTNRNIISYVDFILNYESI